MRGNCLSALYKGIRWMNKFNEQDDAEVAMPN